MTLKGLYPASDVTWVAPPWLVRLMYDVGGFLERWHFEGTFLCQGVAAFRNHGLVF